MLIVFKIKMINVLISMMVELNGGFFFLFVIMCFFNFIFVIV